MEDQYGSHGHGLETLTQEIHYLYQVHVVKLRQISTWVESWVQKLHTLIDQIDIWMFPKLGLLIKEDSQDDKNIMTRKQPKLPKPRGKNVACFIF